MARYQPDHLEEDTLCLLVHGWTCRATFTGDETRDQLAALEAALEGTDAVFVVAQSLVYVDGSQQVVVGLPVASAHADEGPVEWSLADARAIEARTERVFTPELRARLDPLLDEVPSGPPRWLLVPTGALASGLLAHGQLEDSDPDDDDLIWGTDMTQERHSSSIRGTKLASAFDWDISEVDLSPERCAALGEGGYYVIGRYD